MAENPGADERVAEEESKDTDQKILDDAKARFKVAMDAERDNRSLAADDRRFRKGDQWPAEVKAARELDERPCLVINKMPQFEQQVTNDQRQNRPTIKVHPVDDKADPETAKVLQGIIKHIEVSSNADTARDTGFENAVRGGYGFYRIVTEYSEPDSFEQDIRIKRVRDADSVLLDPNHQEPDGSDAEYGFIFGRVPKDQFIAEYGESKLAQTSDWEIESKQVPDWVDSNTVLVSEYFYKEYENKTIALLSDGQVMEKADAERYVARNAASDVPVEIVKERKARIPSIKWCKLNGVEVLDKTDWPGRWIPIIPIYGAELIVDGKLIRESLIRHAKDPARMYNFWKSCETEAITLAPKAPFVGYAGQFDGYEGIWKTANRRNHAYLEVNPKTINGQIAPLPQRMNAEPPVQAITQASMLAADEVKATMGLYDASLGARSNETSGVAIQRRNQQAQTSNFHFTDNLTRGIKHEGRILVDLIPKVYDTARIARIIGEDGEQKVVKLNQEYQNEAGQLVKHYLNLGKYDVTVDTGPSYATRRQEATTFMQEMVRSYPQTMQVAGDLVMKNMDVPGASELGERFKKTLPPGLADDPKKQPIPPEAQAQMQQMSAMVEQLTGKLNELQSEKDQKLLELESKERIEMKKLEVQLEIKRAELDAKDGIALLNAELAQIEARMNQLRGNEPIQFEDEQPQDVPPEPNGGPMPADVSPEEMHPTGGVVPGNAEGMENGNPSDF